MGLDLYRVDRSKLDPDNLITGSPEICKLIKHIFSPTKLFASTTKYSRSMSTAPGTGSGTIEVSSGLSSLFDSGNVLMSTGNSDMSASGGILVCFSRV